MNDELMISLTMTLIEAVGNISKEKSFIEVWSPPISVILASILTGALTFWGIYKQVSKTQQYSDRLFLAKKTRETI
ncbi:hypothetical protein UA45_02230 [Morganella morganii]|uniref:Uncharacterized protein n=1 Tax=Morganella morganii TaxID=582 RepID=A0A0D8LAJ0_MORMO|nr:hypothetical protein UA45_02230 [Morganella morganii]